MSEPGAGLAEQVARLSRHQQELIATRDRLDREVSRFAQMHEFYARAISADGLEQLARLSVEAVCQIFEVESAVLIALDWPGLAAGSVVMAEGVEPGRFGPMQFAALRDAVDRDRRQASLWDQAAAIDLVGTGFGQLAAAGCNGSDGTQIALLVAGITHSGARFHAPLERGQMVSFSLMAHQIGSLFQARWHQARIESQVQELELEQQRLKLALEGSAAGLWDWHIDESRVFYSPRWKQMLGYDPDEISDNFREWETRIHPDDLHVSMQRVQRALTDPGHVYENTHRLRHRDGRYIWIMSRGVILRDAAGAARRMVGIHVDVTEAHEAREKAEAASRAKSEFLATMSHEIRTPLNGVTGMLQLLRETPLSAEQERQVDVAHVSAESLMSVINGVLDLSRLESGQIEFEQLPFSPKGELLDAAELLRDQFVAKGVRLDVVLDDAVPAELVGDGPRLRQIVTNLVGNALKFTEAGSVCFEVGGHRVSDSAFALEFAVTDTGIGIDPLALPTLFDAFVQADASTSRRFGGTGLGLAICRRMLAGMSGTIEVDSVLGEGSCFRVTVPLRTREQRLPAIERTAEAAASPAVSCQVLLVEDNAVNQMVAKAMLERMGCDVTVADDGPAAMDRFIEQRFDLVLMDVHMPGTDGLQVTRDLRAMEVAAASRRVPVVALTANVLTETRERCLAAGMDDFVAKPVSKATLSAVVQRWQPVARG